MKTIHIKGYDLNDPLLRRLYNDYCKKDPKFHYVYWENGTTHKAFIAGKNILIRLENYKVIAQVKKYLSQKEYAYEEYDYPYTRKKFQLGLFKKNWEDRHFNISQQLDNLCTIAALELNDKDWNRFLGQIIHIACNTKGINFYDQVAILIEMVYKSLKVARAQNNQEFIK